MIRYAYDLQDFQIEGGPAWISSSRFEVTAKAAGVPAGPDGMRALVRRLLQDRFALRTRTEPRELPLFELVVARRDGKLGEKLLASAFDCDAIIASGTASAEDRTRTKQDSTARSTSSSSSSLTADGRWDCPALRRHHQTARR